MALIILKAAAIVVSVAGFSPLPPARLPPTTHHHQSFKYNLRLRLSTPSLTEDTMGVDAEYPVQIQHQGHSATIFVKEDEPILQALERQSTFSTNRHKPTVEGEKSSDESERKSSALALSNIPNECRRGNCLTCSSRILESSSHNILANVDNGLSPTVASEVTDSGYVLTCCSYVTGPGVVLELDQNDKVWDMVYRNRMCDKDSKQVALEAQARSLRTVNEENVGQWKSRMEENWESDDADGVDE
mmetsp:Transcript_37091/g.68089  ORF Transcript_37091/g.68089 Transcript_37091/m.68089 type:complete len:245 (+) Transcript_37091:97-831(+)|eukprot:CAMPEP_0201933738 /NCGR_PEP_ID=MMETSP0903-20130614/32206_1 /ASSEMBLY_ACC=CAM_ASM_000552 /TAXON_ID=420261 /ORGANISM="Thalassiosira antarctica, Strain CCMP982" /LENGTH=244 /DNA_ID=CAMNT_0048473757 /DNA_START=40 /DNA_END=774 /DNA_ORIENTATION=-